MPPSPTLIARDQRILAGHAAGATILDLALAEEIDPAVVRRVLRAAGITPGPLHPPTADPAADASATGALADPAWLAAEYATKSAKQIARELGCSNDRVYAALRAAGFPMHGPGSYPPPMEITGETAERIVTLYLAGASAQDIAGELSVSAPRVLRFLEERGVKRTKSEVGSLAYAHRRRGVAKTEVRKGAGEAPQAVAARAGARGARALRRRRIRRGDRRSRSGWPRRACTGCCASAACCGRGGRRA